MMALTAIKKWMKDHDPNKPVKPEALGKGTRKVTPPKKKKPAAKTQVKAPAKKTASKTPKVPIPADKPKSGKTAQVAAKKVVKQEAEKPKGLLRDPKTGKLPSANIVPKGKQYKSAGLVKSLGILPKKVKKTGDVASKTTDKVKPSKTPKFDAAMAKKKKPKEKKAGFLNQLFGG